MPRSAMTGSVSRVPKWSWVALLGVSVAAVAGGAYVVLVGHPDDGDLEASGSTWAEFADANPEIAAVVAREYRLQGVVLIAFGALSLVIVWNAFRQGHRWARLASPLIPAPFVIAALTVPKAEVRYTYGTLGLVAIAGVVGAFSASRRGSGS